MKILAVETSCDDTCVAITDDLKILSNVVSSQVKLHAKYGGVYPFLAKREHKKNLPKVFKEALNKANDPKIEAIAVTVGPGLEPCLWMGVNFAKEIAKNWNLPIIPVNHIEAHIIANFIVRGLASNKLPAVCLVVSGGHTQLILMKSYGSYKILGETRDDAAGECFDKVARILGLGYPGGPIISKIAKADRGSTSIALPRPMIHQKNYDFSFSGLKTAVLYHYRGQSEKTRKSKRYIQAMAAEAQQAIIDVLIRKTLKAAKDYRVKTIILGGGVAANNELRRQLKAACVKLNFAHLIPPKKFCTDNAAMIGACAFFHWPKGKRPREKIEAQANLRV